MCMCRHLRSPKAATGRTQPPAHLGFAPVQKHAQRTSAQGARGGGRNAQPSALDATRASTGAASAHARRETRRREPPSCGQARASAGAQCASQTQSPRHAIVAGGEILAAWNLGDGTAHARPLRSQQHRTHTRHAPAGVALRMAIVSAGTDAAQRCAVKQVRRGGNPNSLRRLPRFSSLFTAGSWEKPTSVTVQVQPEISESESVSARRSS